MYLVEKIIQGKSVNILVDVHSNGRICIDGDVVCQFESCHTKPIAYFKSDGWVVSPKDSPFRIKRGNFIGSPQNVDYLDSATYDFAVKDHYTKAGERDYYIAPVPWIENAITLIIKEDFEELKKKRVYMSL